MVNFQVIGLNYKTASVEERESTLKVFRGFSGILLATCNRVELYYRNPKSEILNSKSQIQNIYHYENEEAIRHLFRVAAGLDSQILGEWEILGQVREAFLRAKGSSPFLDFLFERAIEVGRMVRIETGISRGNTSVASTAIAKAKEWMNETADKKIILIGSGKVSVIILKTLLKMRTRLVMVANRTYERAAELAEKIGGKAVRFSQLRKELQDADLVISSTAAPHLVLRKEQIGVRRKPLIIIDLAVPRDIDPGISKLAGITLLNIDDIREEINFNLARRKVEAVFAERIIEEEVNNFCEKSALALAVVA